MKGTLTRSSELREQAVPEAAFPFELSSNICSGILLLLKSPLTLVFLYLHLVTNLVQGGMFITHGLLKMDLAELKTGQ